MNKNRNDNMKLCECGCGQPVANEGNRFIGHHNLKKYYQDSDFQSKVGKLSRKNITDEERKECGIRLKRELRDWRESNPEKAKEQHIENGKRFMLWYHQEFSKGNPDLYEKNQKDNAVLGGVAKRKWVEDNPVEAHRHAVERGKRRMELLREELGEEEFIKFCIDAFQSLHKNKPFVWNDVHFMSKQEMDVAKVLLTIPIDNVNCNIRIGSKFIDFFPQEDDKRLQGVFVEFHPWDFKGRSIEQYTRERELVIENSKYRGIPLVVITSIKDIP